MSPGSYFPLPRALIRRSSKSCDIGICRVQTLRHVGRGNFDYVSPAIEDGVHMAVDHLIPRTHEDRLYRRISRDIGNERTSGRVSSRSQASRPGARAGHPLYANPRRRCPGHPRNARDGQPADGCSLLQRRLRSRRCARPHGGLGLFPESVTGQALVPFIADLAQVGNAAAKPGYGRIAGVVVNAQFGDVSADISIHKHEVRFFFELESAASARDTEVALSISQTLMLRMDKKTEVGDLVCSAARLVRAFAWL
jgi:hypothetical protein